MKNVRYWLPILVLTCVEFQGFSQGLIKTAAPPTFTNQTVYLNLASAPYTYAAFVLNYEKRISKKGHLLARGGLGRTFQDDGYNFVVVALTAISKPLRASHFEFTIGFQNWPNPYLPAINVGYRYQKPRKPLFRVSLGTEGVLVGLGYAFGQR